MNLENTAMTSNASRRQFLKQAGALSIAGNASPLALNLAAIGEAAAASAGHDDYKALVCIFLMGGNDHANTVIPFDAVSHDAYKSFRPVTHVPHEQLGATLLKPLTPLPDGRQFALSPSLKPLAPLFNQERVLAPLLNIGPLVEPVTKSVWNKGGAKLPRKLFSHNDQTSIWQSCQPEGAPSGWAGRMGDLLMSNNQGQGASFTCINTAGNAVLLTGGKVTQYCITKNGPVPIAALQRSLYGSPACSRAMESILKETRTQFMEQALQTVTKRSIDLAGFFSNALNDALPFPGLFEHEPDELTNPLAEQLKVVAQTIIGLRNDLSVKRQVFLVTMGGFDTHDDLATRHPALMSNLADAMRDFYTATKRMGISDKVTTFTASEFGRSWGNADGSDHGWGGMHFVMGGAVKGGEFIGKAPAIADNGPDDVGQGRLIPTLAVDQLAATLGRWMGLSNSQLLDVLPDLKNFNVRNLGFLG